MMNDNAAHRSPLASLQSFVIKAFVVAFFATCSMLIIVAFVVSEFEERIAQVEQRIGSVVQEFSGPKFWQMIERELDRAADPQRALPEAKRQLWLARIRGASAQWRPFILEAYAAATEPGAPAK